MKCSVIILVLMGLTWSGASAQEPSVVRLRPLWQSASENIMPYEAHGVVEPSRDYRWEGMAAGAVVVGVLGGYLANQLCVHSDVADRGSCTGRTLLGGLVGGAVGATIGVLIGGQFAKGD